jgi:hypothetical protein
MAESKIGSDKIELRDGAALKEKGAAQADTLVKSKSIIIRGIIEHVGEVWFNEAVKLQKAQCAKHGVFGWEPDDTNVLFELAPAPKPCLGEWCYRTRMVGYTKQGDLIVTETFLPKSQLVRYGKNVSFSH